VTPRILAGLATLAYLAWIVVTSPGTAKTPVFVVGVALVYMWLWLVARWHVQPRSWVRWIRQTIDVQILCIVLVYGLAVFSTTPSAITSDGCLYFGYLRSATFDGDLEIERELEVLSLPERAHAVVPVGPNAVWAIPYGTVYLADHAGRSMDLWEGPADATTDGLGGPYVWAVLLTSFLVGAAGLLALHLRLRELFAPQVALLATLLTYSATTLVWYMLYEPSLPHAASFGLTALFLVAADRWARDRPLSAPHAAVLGTLFGLMILVRPQNGLFGIFLLAFVVSLRFSPRLRLRLSATPQAVGAFVAPLVPMALLQWWMARALLARQPYSLIGDRGYLNFLDPRWSEVLFSSWHGFFSWTPVAYVAFIGTVIYLRRDRRWAISALLVFAAMVWVNGSPFDWHGAWAFGGRRFTSTLAALAPGLAALLATVWRRPVLIVAPLAFMVAYWNFLLMVQWNFDRLPREEPVSFESLTQEQVRLHYESTEFFPFAFPANLLFSWREGLPMGKYDLLGVVRPEREFFVSFDEGVDRFLLEGWTLSGCAPNTNGCRSFRSAGEIAVPLDPQGTAELAVAFRAWLVQPGESAELVVRANGQRIGRLRLTSSPTRFQLSAPPDKFRRGFNRVQFRLVASSRVADTPEAAAMQTEPVERPGPQRVAVGVLRVTPHG
jgi:hypothetical protein